MSTNSVSESSQGEGLENNMKYPEISLNIEGIPSVVFGKAVISNNLMYQFTEKFHLQERIIAKVLLRLSCIPYYNSCFLKLLFFVYVRGKWLFSSPECVPSEVQILCDVVYPKDVTISPKHKDDLQYSMMPEEIIDSIFVDQRISLSVKTELFRSLFEVGDCYRSFIGLQERLRCSDSDSVPVFRSLVENVVASGRILRKHDSLEYATRLVTDLSKFSFLNSIFISSLNEDSTKLVANVLLDVDFENCEKTFTLCELFWDSVSDTVRFMSGSRRSRRIALMMLFISFEIDLPVDLSLTILFFYHSSFSDEILKLTDGEIRIETEDVTITPPLE